MAKKLLVIDNYDSFTYNLVQLFRRFDLVIKVFRSDQITLEQAGGINPDYLLISPGPKDPAHAGLSIPLINAFYRHIPVLGVCLGMQCINELFGGQTVRANLPMHGKTSTIHHNQSSVFKGLPSPFTAARYHSLVIEPGPDTLNQLTISAKTDDEIIRKARMKTQPYPGRPGQSRQGSTCPRPGAPTQVTPGPVTGISGIPLTLKFLVSSLPGAR